jgi:hypothetical protein
MSNTELANITPLILTVRAQRVILDADLAALYQVAPKRLNEQVKRNTERFPEEFSFQLTKEEAEALRRSRSQNATLKRGQNIKYLPRVFTEHGALMAANVLNSPRAVSMSVAIVKAFVRLRQMALSVEELAGKLNSLEKRYDGQFKIVFDALRQLMTPPENPKPQIGFHSGNKKEVSPGISQPAPPNRSKRKRNASPRN